MYCIASPAVCVFLLEKGIALFFLGIVVCRKLLLPYQDMPDKSEDPFPSWPAPSAIKWHHSMRWVASCHHHGTMRALGWRGHRCKQRQNYKSSKKKLVLCVVKGPWYCKERLGSLLLVPSALLCAAFNMVMILADTLWEQFFIIAFVELFTGPFWSWTKHTFDFLLHQIAPKTIYRLHGKQNPCWD